MLTEFRVITAGADRDWPEVLAAKSDGWAVHLHNGMRALAAALVKAGGHLNAVDPEAVLEHAGCMRWNHYEFLRGGELAGTKCLLKAVLHSAAGGCRRRRCAQRNRKACPTGCRRILEPAGGHERVRLLQADGMARCAAGDAG